MLIIYVVSTVRLGKLRHKVLILIPLHKLASLAYS